MSPGLVPCAGEGHIGPLDATVSLVPSRPGRQDTELKVGGRPSYGHRVVPAMWVQGLCPQAGCPWEDPEVDQTLSERAAPDSSAGTREPCRRRPSPCGPVQSWAGEPTGEAWMALPFEAHSCPLVLGLTEV